MGLFSFQEVEYVPRIKGHKVEVESEADRPSNDPVSFRLVALYAKDWGIYQETLHRSHDFVMVYGWIVGVLIAEDDEKIVLAHEWFPGDNDVRHTSVIPKVCIERQVMFDV